MGDFQLNRGLVVNNIFRMKIAFSIVLSAAMLFSSSSMAQTMDKVVYGTASRVGLANAAMYLAETMGFFREEHIEITTVQFDSTSILMPQIASKAVTIGYPIPDPVIVSHDEGKDPLPIQFFYNVTRIYNWEMVVPADSPIKTLADLKGKTIGVIGLGVGNVPVTRSYLREAGLNPGEDVQIIGVGQGAAAINAFKSGKIDALNQFDVVHAQMENEGIAIRRIPIPEKYLGLSGNSFATHVETIRDNPDLVRRFGRAYTKGLVACEANPSGCVEMMWKKYPETRPTNGDPAKNLENNVRILLANLRTKIPMGDLTSRQYGVFTKESWQTSLDVLAQNGLVKDVNIDLSKLYTNKFVPDFGRFDAAAVIDQAKAIGKQ
jgi:NitT/TauT family transport system substrate-binding protein